MHINPENLRKSTAYDRMPIFSGGLVSRRETLSTAEKKLLKTFGNRVRRAREQAKKSVYDVTGEDMPIKNRQHWQMIENGKKNIQLTTISKIAESLKTDIAKLFD